MNIFDFTVQTQDGKAVPLSGLSANQLAKAVRAAYEAGNLI